MDQTASPAPDSSPTVSRPTLHIDSLLIPFLAVLTAVIIGGIFVLLAGLDPIKVYQSLLQGSLGSDVALTRSLLKMTPFILSGLAVAFAFKGGLFNIGAQGQLVIGSLCSAWAGFALHWPIHEPATLHTFNPVTLQFYAMLPAILHIPLALGAGILGGMFWGLIPGLLKAYTGAHEVISTIMLNYIASLLLEWAVVAARPTTPAGPLAYCNTLVPNLNTTCALGKTPPILPSAYLPVVYQPSGSISDNLHLGVFIAIAVALLVWAVLYKTTFGFEIRTIGLNPNAACYAGINVPRLTVIIMVIAGGLAGLAGAIQTQGLYHEFEVNQSLTTGFDSIAVALLPGSSPIGIIPSAFLFGAMNAGSGQMQLDSHVPTELIQIIQALILMFVAADQIVRHLYRIKARGGEQKIKLSTGWGQR